MVGVFSPYTGQIFQRDEIKPMNTKQTSEAERKFPDQEIQAVFEAYSRKEMDRLRKTEHDFDAPLYQEALELVLPRLKVISKVSFGKDSLLSAAYFSVKKRKKKLDLEEARVVNHMPESVPIAKVKTLPETWVSKPYQMIQKIPGSSARGRTAGGLTLLASGEKKAPDIQGVEVSQGMSMTSAMPVEDMPIEIYGMETTQSSDVPLPEHPRAMAQADTTASNLSSIRLMRAVLIFLMVSFFVIACVVFFAGYSVLDWNRPTDKGDNLSVPSQTNLERVGENQPKNMQPAVESVGSIDLAEQEQYGEAGGISTMADLERQSVEEEVLSTKKSPLIEEVAEVFEPPPVENVATVEEAVAVSEPPPVENSVTVEEVVAVSEPPPVENVAAVEEVAEIPEPPPVENIVVVEEAPEVSEPLPVENVAVVEEVAEIPEPPPVENVAAVEEVAEVSEPLPVENVAVVDEAAEVSEPPPVENSVTVEEVVAVSEPAPVENVAAVEEAAEVSEPPPVEIVATVEEVAAVSEPLPVENVAEIEEVPEVEEAVDPPVNSEKIEKLHIVIVDISRLNMRDGPNTRHPRLKTLNRGTVLTVKRVEKGWLQVQDSDNVVGWVSGVFTQDPISGKRINPAKWR